MADRAFEIAFGDRQVSFQLVKVYNLDRVSQFREQFAELLYVLARLVVFAKQGFNLG